MIRLDPPWRVLVTGSRDLIDGTSVWDALDAELAERHEIIVVHGGARGADQAAEAWAVSKDNAYPEAHPANWSIGKIAGHMRNQNMVNLGADICLAFPLFGSRGTWDCVRRAEHAGIPVKIFEARKVVSA